MPDVPNKQATRQYHGSEIAVVGMSCRVPGAPDATSFWKNLANGVESVRFFSIDELRDHGVSESLLRDANYVRANAVLDGIDLFDSDFFGFSARDAAIMDPQHRLFLECAWESLEDAGYDPFRYDGSIGVFGGCGMNAYMMYNLVTNPDLMDSVGEFLIRHTGNDKDFLCTRVSYNLNLTGPSINIQTACSTSLVAVHVASQHLLSGECDIALAGAVTIQIDQMKGYRYSEGEVLSRDGHCRPFDADASGTVFGSGAGIVVLKRLDDAVRDRDTIHAVIRGSAVNNDGSLKVSYFAPSVDGHARAIAEAVAMADVDPDTVTYVETHGTGTPVGDPIEFAALSQAYGAAQSGEPCALGSVKSNIGHLDTAAGVISLIKAILAIEHGVIPPTLHYHRPNPELGIESTRFYVNAAPEEWNPKCGIRRAGVSSLGVGGTNAHVVVEEAPTLVKSSRAESNPPSELVVIPLSARTPAALRDVAAWVSDSLLTDDCDLTDAAFTLSVGRAEWRHRGTVVADSTLAAARQLRSDQFLSGRVEALQRAFPVFLFSGGGAQYAGMGAGLYGREPVYSNALDRSAAHLSATHKIDLHSVLFSSGEQPRQAVEMRNRQPTIALAALFATQYAMGQFWLSRGVKPGAMIGHSMGEYTAACLSGVFTPEEAIDVVARRGRLFETLEKGGMLSVSLPEADLRSVLAPELAVAANNAPESSVASGPLRQIEELEVELTRRGVECSRIQIDVAAHSPMVDSILDDFEQFVGDLKLRKPTIPFASNVTGDWITEEQATDPKYWVQHLRQTVRFSEAVSRLFGKHETVLIEVGPGRALTTLARMHPTFGDTRSVLSMRHPKEVADDMVVLKQAVGTAWSHGIEIDWGAEFASQSMGRIPLPTYPFERKSYWMAPGQGRRISSAASVAETSVRRIRKRADLPSWIYVPRWRPLAVNPLRVVDERRSVVIVGDSIGVADLVADELRASGHHVVFVQPDVDSIVEVVGNKAATGELTDLIVMSPLDAAKSEVLDASVDKMLKLTFFPILEAVKSATADRADDLRVYVFTQGAFNATRADGPPNPWGAMLRGTVGVLSREIPEADIVQCDLSPLDSIETQAAAVVRALVFEPGATQGLGTVRALRGETILSESIEPGRPPMQASLIRRKGTYAFTGGLGGIALSVAREFAERYEANIVLLAREPFPDRAIWPEIVRTATDQRTIERIRAIREIESAGTVVVVEAADVTETGAIEAALRRAARATGQVRGILHTAGVLNDGPALLKTHAEALAVLKPKIDGSLGCIAAGRNLGCDVVVLFGSSSAFLTPAGQVDYATANAFVDAAARAADSTDCRVLAINWGMWRNVGMTRHERAASHARASEEFDHALFYGRSVRSDGIAFHARLDAATDWYINEHRLADRRALMPGTVVLELARAAFELVTGSDQVRLYDVLFELPVFVPENKAVEISLVMRPDGEAYRFSVETEDDGEPIEHAFGRAEPISEEENPGLVEVSHPAPESEIPFGRGSNQDRYLRFGPRWNCIESVAFGSGEASANLVLPDSYTSESQQYGLHPALLDIATGFAPAVSPEYLQNPGLYVPISYGSVRVLASLPSSCRSYVKLNPSERGPSGIISFDVVIHDLAGDAVVVIEDFLMKRVDSESLPDADVLLHGNPTTLMEIGSMFGIETNEGTGLLQMLMAEGGQPSHIVSSVDWNVLLDVQSAGERAPGARNKASETYKEPTDEIERSLADMWGNLLGTERIGIDEDFFDLGGHSIIAVRLFSRIRGTFGVDLSLATLFEASTISSVADLIRDRLRSTGRLPAASGDGVAESTDATLSVRRKASPGKPWSPLVPIRSSGTGRPFFCVHGAGGNVLNFRDLALLLPSSRAFYGLQARGADGNERAHDSIEAMASAYLVAIKSIQPQGPYLIGGYSGGGLVSIEMARQLDESGDNAELVVLLDTFYPHLPPRPGQTLPQKIHAGLLLAREHGLSYLRTLFVNRAKHLAFRWRAFQLGLRNRLGLELPVALREIVMVDAFHGAAADYRVRKYTGDVVLFTASDRSHIFAHLSHGLEWEPHLPELRIVTIPGNHDNLVRQPHVQTLANLLEAELQKAESGIAAAEKPAVR